MEKGKIIVIEGTDCSGKETQSNLLIERLKRDGIKAQYMCYPRYDSPTGKIIGWPYLGKSYIVDDMIDEAVERIIARNNISLEKLLFMKVIIDDLKEELAHGWFKDGADSVNPKVASLYYAADRLAHQPEIEELINSGFNVVIDRYIYSNFAHQGGKKATKTERNAIYEWNEQLELGLLGLLPADLKIFLHMPVIYANLIKAKRKEKLDEHENNIEHLFHAEQAYLEIAKKYDFDIVQCVRKTQEEPILEDILKKEVINDEVYNIVKRRLNLK